MSNPSPEDYEKPLAMLGRREEMVHKEFKERKIAVLREQGKGLTGTG